MKRRHFLQLTGATLAAVSLVQTARAAQPPATDAKAFRAMRKYANLSFGRIAYVDRGTGDAALFLHGAPLNSFQWRGAIDLLSPYRRCIAPDFMGLGYSEVPEHQALDARAQLEMLVALLDSLGIRAVDIVASDSGGAVAQLFVAHYPKRVRTLLLTNCDVEPNSPPPGIKPILDMARAGTLADMTAEWLTDRAKARATFGAAVFVNPAQLTDEIIDYYVQPLVSSPLRRSQYERYHLALTPNPLAGIESRLAHSTVPVRIVWGGSDTLFPQTDAAYLDRIFPRSQGVHVIPEAKLFFQEEYPSVIAAEARRVWGMR
ncbi:alpha/beta fold hydrolase [Massilia endophytica]|uniref:alpha/beta fold hydrolase n=1 Tax=Massilia endophytica TaxID=2899220 RepID=UPI001E326244|nr:alpha/beta hydrolase [Massilia endophytica]UGQ46157.1 alpha/beta hydrolase [Massilia endophytica]